MSASRSLPPETIVQPARTIIPISALLDGPVPSISKPVPSAWRRCRFLSLPPEILTQIANETHAVDAYNLRQVHPQLYHLFRPENNLFWFKTTLKDYIVHYGPPPKPSPPDSEAADSVPPEISQSPFWDTLWRLNLMSRSADSARGSSKLKEQLYKYDPNFKYYDRIQTTIKEKRGCQVCCVGSLSESKYFGSISRRLCTFCFDDMTISRPKMRYLKLKDNAYRFVKYRRKNGSVQYACWLPDVLRVLPPDFDFTSIHDIERTHDLKYNATKTALSKYRDKTREAVQLAAVEVFSDDAAYAGFRNVFPVEKMEDYVYGLETVPGVDDNIVRICKKPKTKVWCVEVAQKDILPQFDIVEDEDFEGPKKYAVDRRGVLSLVVGGKKVLRREGVPPPITSAVFKYHEERFVRLGAGWDHRGMQGDDKLMFGYCQICMDKKLRETGDLQKVEVERRKRKRGMTDEGSFEREVGGINSEGTGGGEQLLLSSTSQQTTNIATGASTPAYPTPVSLGIRQTSSPTPISLSPAGPGKRHKKFHNTEAETALAKYLPQLYTTEAAASFPSRPAPRGLVSDSEQVKYTGKELADHYEACHLDRFYSGEATGEARRYERGKGGYWFWNLGDEIDEQDEMELDGQENVNVDGETNRDLSTVEDMFDVMGDDDVGEGSSSR